MNMRTVERMRRLGWIVFAAMWVPFTCVFAGMVAEFGGWGRQLAASFPLLLAPNADGFSTLSGVAFVMTFGAMFVSMGLLLGAPLLAAIANRRLACGGTLARATIKSAAQTGTYINDNPVVRFELEVQPVTGGPFDAEAELLVQLIEIPKFQPGKEVAVRYDPVTLEVAISREPLP